MKKSFIKKEEKKIKKEWKNIIFDLVFVFLNVFLVILFYKNILLTSILLILVTLVGLLKWRSWVTFGAFVVGTFVGPVCEMWAISQGVWQYSVTNFFMIPLWLIIVWGNTSAFLYQIAVEIHKLGVKK